MKLIKKQWKTQNKKWLKKKYFWKKRRSKRQYHFHNWKTCTEGKDWLRNSFPTKNTYLSNRFECVRVQLVYKVKRQTERKNLMIYGQTNKTSRLYSYRYKQTLHCRLTWIQLRSLIRYTFFPVLSTCNKLI